MAHRQVIFEKYRVRPDGSCEKLTADDALFTVNVVKEELPRCPFALLDKRIRTIVREVWLPPR